MALSQAVLGKGPQLSPRLSLGSSRDERLQGESPRSQRGTPSSSRGERAKPESVHSRPAKGEHESPRVATEDDSSSQGRGGSRRRASSLLSTGTERSRRRGSVDRRRRSEPDQEGHTSDHSSGREKKASDSDKDGSASQTSRSLRVAGWVGVAYGPVRVHHGGRTRPRGPRCIRVWQLRCGSPLLRDHWNFPGACLLVFPRGSSRSSRRASSRGSGDKLQRQLSELKACEHGPKDRLGCATHKVCVTFLRNCLAEWLEECAVMLHRNDQSREYAFSKRSSRRLCASR